MMVSVWNIIMRTIQLVQFFNIFNHSNKAVVVLDLKDRIVQIFQICHKLINLCKCMFCFSFINWASQSFEIIDMSFYSSKMMFVIWNFINWSNQRFKICNIFVEFLICMLMLNVEYRPIHLFKIIKVLLNFTEFVFSVYIHYWVVEIL